MIVGVLLAAGSSTRFGAHKLLHPLSDGIPIAAHAARHLISALPVSIAVVRREDVMLREMLANCGLTIVECAAALQGMGASIGCGASATPKAAGWVIALADMPWVRPATIYSIAQQLRTGAGIVAPQYQGRRGHPVGFAGAFKARLLALQRDVGARELIEESREHLVLNVTDDSGVLLDIDLPKDVERNFSSC